MKVKKMYFWGSRGNNSISVLKTLTCLKNIQYEKKNCKKSSRGPGVLAKNLAFTSE
jgi:hypothetical protein